MTFDLESLGWDEHFRAAYPAHGRGDHHPARVLRVDRGVCTTLAAAGVRRASLAGTVLASAARDPSLLPCAGDWVVLRHWPDDRITVQAVLPRLTAVVRRTAGRGSTGQVLAANMDTAAVVEPLDPAPDLGRVERLLALAWDSGADPLVVLTKADLVAEPAAVAAQVAGVAQGTPVLVVDATSAAAAGPLSSYVSAGRTLALLGASGAGKSSLVNALASVPVMPIQHVRRVDGKGRHTTTYRALVPLPGGGAVLDTPGLRGVGLLDGAAGLGTAFADVAELARGCRFRDCGHGSEPGCAVTAALESGELTPRRMRNWQKLRDEIARESRRRTVRQVSTESISSGRRQRDTERGRAW